MSLCIFLLGNSFASVFEHSQDSASIRQFELQGTPRIIHYTRKDFRANPQVWSMCQDEEGIMYFGNNDGVLIFDGARWQKIALPNNSAVRSLFFSAGKVYAGGYNEFGQVKKDIYGNYQYESYVGLIRPEDRDFENIWAIHSVQGYIVFRSFTRLIALTASKALTIPTNNAYLSSVVDGSLFITEDEGIHELDLATLEVSRIVPSNDYDNEYISAILKGNKPNELLVISREGRAFDYSTDSGMLTQLPSVLSPQSNNQILSAIRSSDGYYYLGTLSTQIMILNADGSKALSGNSFLQLQDNTVLNLYESAEGNIWALLNNGIDCINISSPVSILFENASVFDVKIHNEKVYAATNQGVFVSDPIDQNFSFSALRFEKIAGLEGQAWSLQKFQDNIICSHDRGVFIISGKETQQLEGISGVWKMIPVHGEENLFFACTYNNIHVVAYTGTGEFKVIGQIEGFNESSRDIMQSEEPGVFWVCHGYKGVFRLKINNSYRNVVSLEHFTEKGLPSPFNINVFRWNGETVFTTNHGIFTYNDEESRFEPHDVLNKILGSDKNIRKILQFEDKTWFVQDDEVGYFSNSEPGTLQKGLFLELKGTLNRGMECILPINKDRVLIGTNIGLYAYDLSFQPSAKTPHTLLTYFGYEKDGEKVRIPIRSEEEANLPYGSTDIRFEFAAPRLKDQALKQYSYFLEGVDEGWSPWNDLSTKAYTQLLPGDYTFHVKARNMFGELASKTSISFVIDHVWYQSPLAYLMYALVLLAGLYSSRKLVRRKIKAEKDKTRKEEKIKQNVLELKIQQMRLEREKERITKDKEKLEENVIYKSKELANYTILLVRKRKLLTDMKAEIMELKQLAKNEKSREKLRLLGRKIAIHLNDEEHIKVFEANFEHVHHEFFTQLKAYYPDLTAKELRLCALVKMNLSNKEISPILNISIRGVETARYRLRKRLSLNHEENMVEFLEKLDPRVIKG